MIRVTMRFARFILLSSGAFDVELDNITVGKDVIPFYFDSGRRRGYPMTGTFFPPQTYESESIGEFTMHGGGGIEHSRPCLEYRRF